MYGGWLVHHKPLSRSLSVSVVRSRTWHAVCLFFSELELAQEANTIAYLIMGGFLLYIYGLYMPGPGLVRAVSNCRKEFFLSLKPIE